MNRTPEQESAFQEYILAKERYDAAERVRGAATDLLEALKALRDECIGFVPQCAEQVDAAIAKAEGK